ncbi:MULTISPECIES: ABC transporter permease [unclassified Mycoplasma]|uniref:ABC transporter permease n=1 Tax=unclassified Mycoplasma TaxID=2683645 RepID=UPI00216B5A0E|nr:MULTISPECIES: sugar ABC transporter permease [unclassified Mycoplasma]MCS4536993.1 sugar ABC transporter permease [Mycoplasma sp. CSL7475-4]MCT4469364.1 sugar ABC transporter permease [Mycoplasma sp. HS2188]
MKTKHNLSDSLRTFSQKMSNFIKMDKTKSTGRKVASSLWALFFGIVLSFVYIFLKKAIFDGYVINPFQIVNAVIDSLNSNNKEYIVNFFLVFGFSSLACALSFKAGLFNIGIPGQMMISGATSFGIFIKMAYNSSKEIPLWVLFVALIFSMLFAFIVGLISGALKAHLNVHEVISTIMVNWIIVGISMILFQQKSASIIWPELKPEQINAYFDDTNTGVKPGFAVISSAVKNAFVIGGIISLIALVIAIAFIFNFTSLGYKIRMQGVAKTNGKYMGVNDKMLTMLILAFSAMIASIAGFYQYVIAPSVAFNRITEPLVIGFESIAISLLALNSPIGIVFSSLFYTALYSSQYTIQLDPLYLKPEDLQVITSMILYLAATSVMFSNFKPLRSISRGIALIKDPRYLANYKLNMLERKRISLTNRYNLALHRIEYNVDDQNYEKMLAKLQKLEEKYQKNLLLNNILTERAKIGIINANKVYDLQVLLHNAKLAKNHELISQYKKEIKDLVAFQKQEAASFGSVKESINSLSVPAVELAKGEISNKKRVKQIKVEIEKMTDKYLSSAMNYKNSEKETIENFEYINNQKQKMNLEMSRLGSTRKFNLKQEKIASEKSIKAKFQAIYNNIIEQRFAMLKDYRTNKGGK